jgi:hypothetical protein
VASESWQGKIGLDVEEEAHLQVWEVTQCLAPVLRRGLDCEGTMVNARPRLIRSVSRDSEVLGLVKLQSEKSALAFVDDDDCRRTSSELLILLAESILEMESQGD